MLMSSLSDRVSTVPQKETTKSLVTEEAAEVNQLSADLLRVSKHMHANTQTNITTSMIPLLSKTCRAWSSKAL